MVRALAAVHGRRVRGRRLADDAARAAAARGHRPGPGDRGQRQGERRARRQQHARGVGAGPRVPAELLGAADAGRGPRVRRCGGVYAHVDRHVVQRVHDHLHLDWGVSRILRLSVGDSEGINVVCLGVGRPPERSRLSFKCRRPGILC